MSEALNDVVRVALAHANVDTDLECCHCGIPLLPRQAVWAEDVTYCEPCAAVADARAEAMAEAQEEELEFARECEQERIDNGQFGMGT